MTENKQSFTPNTDFPNRLTIDRYSINRVSGVTVRSEDINDLSVEEGDRSCNVESLMPAIVDVEVVD